MSANLTLSLLVGVLIGSGVVLLMARGITRALLGVLLMGNGINIVFLIASGRAGQAPIVGISAEADMADPIPQALTLTALVITLALTGFVLALAHRSAQLSRTDVVEDDDEDTRIGLKAIANDMSDSDFHGGIDKEPLDPDDDPDPGACHPHDAGHVAQRDAERSAPGFERNGAHDGRRGGRLDGDDAAKSVGGGTR